MPSWRLRFGLPLFSYFDQPSAGIFFFRDCFMPSCRLSRNFNVRIEPSILRVTQDFAILSKSTPSPTAESRQQAGRVNSLQHAITFQDRRAWFPLCALLCLQCRTSCACLIAASNACSSPKFTPLHPLITSCDQPRYSVRRFIDQS